jgi:hypothetical protein
VFFLNDDMQTPKRDMKMGNIEKLRNHIHEFGLISAKHLWLVDRRLAKKNNRVWFRSILVRIAGILIRRMINCLACGLLVLKLCSPVLSQEDLFFSFCER